MATSKDYLDYKRKNLCSTKEPVDVTTDIFPAKISNKSNTAFLTFFQAKPDNNTVYTNLTGRFPMISSSGKNYILILYH